MKRNDFIFLLSVALYSFLFYRQTAGLNFMIFSIAMIGALGLMRPESVRKKHWMASALLVLISGISVYIHGSGLSIAANIVSLLLLGAQSAAPGTSIFISYFLSSCTVGGSYVFVFIDYFDRRASRAAGEASTGKRKSGRFWAVFIAIVVVLLFFGLYRSTNVLFKELTKHINLDWISWGWCMFTGLGSLAIYGLLYVRKFGGIGESSPNYQRNLQQKPETETEWGDSMMSEDNERFMGTLLLVLLNVLVLFVNGVDLLFQFGDGKLPEGITYTSYVHQGVGLLIVNVLLAMLLVLFFFRGRLNYNRGYNLLRWLAVAWLFQNVLMLFFMAGRNNLYTEMFGMTYKRIGVYFYLLLTAIGAASTAVKVYNRKTNTWLFRINSWLFLVVFVFSSTVSWTRVITWYSLYKSDYINRAYISSLSYQSLPYLVDLNLHPEKFSQREMNESFESDNDIVQLYDQLMNRDWGNKNEFSLRLYRKVYSQLVSCRRTNWRSSNYNVNRVEKELLAFPKFGDDHVLQLDYSDIDELAYFTGFSGIERIDAGNNSITSIGELGKYPMLEEVSLENNELTSLNGIERCNKLTYLNVEGNNITDFSPLIKVITLKRIDVSNLNESGIAALRAARPDIIIE